MVDAREMRTRIKTAEICDEFEEGLQVAEPLLTNFGGRRAFHGPISTVKVFEDNSLIRDALESPGKGRVLVVDGGGSRRCALLGEMLVRIAEDSGWAGIVVYGCIRDAAEIGKMSIGLKALALNPRRSIKRGEGQWEIPVNFAGVTFRPGEYLYSDQDGIVIAAKALHL
jgi:regulator of ribonuclease activity A